MHNVYESVRQEWRYITIHYSKLLFASIAEAKFVLWWRINPSAGSEFILKIRATIERGKCHVIYRPEDPLYTLDPVATIIISDTLTLTF